MADHRIDTDKGLDGNHWPRCACGWVGHPWPSEAAAYREGDEHILAAIGAES